MGRPIKTGLEYFPFDIDFFDDPKLLFISEKYEEKGEIVVIKLLTWIYRNGYYIVWNNDISMIFAKRNFNNIKSDFVNEVVNELIKRDFFDKTMYEKYGILTSRGIQKRWNHIVNQLKRKVKIDPKYDLISGLNYDEMPINSEENTAIKEETNAETEESTQKEKKGKEKKIKERKGKEIEISAKEEETPAQNKDPAAEILIRSYGRSPTLPEREFIEQLISRFGENKTLEIMKEAKLRNFRSFRTLENALDENGNIKAKDNSQTSNLRVYTYKELMEKHKNDYHYGATYDPIANEYVLVDYYGEPRYTRKEDAIKYNLKLWKNKS